MMQEYSQLCNTQHNHKVAELSHTDNSRVLRAHTATRRVLASVLAPPGCLDIVVRYCGAAVLRGFGLTSPSCTGRM